jgi:membrane-associated phospholipid phosphatase
MDLISFSVGLVYIIPFVLFYITGNTIHLTGFFGVTGTTILSEFLKHYIIRDASPRPRGATNCDLLCQDGKQGGKPGMPSSHSASVAFFSAFYFKQTDNLYIRIFLVLYAALVMLSRHLKRCHTIYQIGTGALLGFLISQYLSA